MRQGIQRGGNKTDTGGLDLEHGDYRLPFMLNELPINLISGGESQKLGYALGDRGS